MKLTKTNNDELYIARGGYSALAVGAVMGIGGIVGLLLSLHVASQGGMIGRLAAGAAIVAGVAAILLASKREVFLRRGGTSEVRTTNVLFRKVKSVTFGSDQIAAVGFETHDEYSGASDNNNGVQTRNRESSMWLILKDTTEIPLFSVTRSANSPLTVGGIGLNGANRAPLYNEATTIADFFGVPLRSRAATQSLPTNLGIFADSARRMMDASANNQSVSPVSPAPIIVPPQSSEVQYATPSSLAQPGTDVMPEQPHSSYAPTPERGGIQIPPRST